MSTAIGKLKSGKAKKRSVVDLTAWDCGKLGIQELSGNERVELSRRYRGDDGILDDEAGLAFYCEVVQLGVINDDGERCLTAEDVAAMRDNAVSALNEIAQAILVLSGIGKPAQVEAEKN